MPGSDLSSGGNTSRGFHRSSNEKYRSSEVIHDWQEQRSEIDSSQPIVNNFAGRAALGFGWPVVCILVYPYVRFPASAGQAC